MKKETESDKTTVKRWKTILKNEMESDKTTLKQQLNGEKRFLKKWDGKRQNDT